MTKNNIISNRYSPIHGCLLGPRASDTPCVIHCFHFHETDSHRLSLAGHRHATKPEQLPQYFWPTHWREVPAETRGKPCLLRLWRLHIAGWLTKGCVLFLAKKTLIGILLLISWQLLEKLCLKKKVEKQSPKQTFVCTSFCMSVFLIGCIHNAAAGH